MKKILCIAQTFCDLIFGNLPREPGLGEEVYGDTFVVRPGGGANTPIHLGRLGADVTLLTGVGSDEMGEKILSELRHSGVRVCGAIARPGTRTAVSAVLSTAADRSFASFGGTEGPFFTPEQLEEEICRADIVYTYLGYCAAYPVAQICKRFRKPLFLEASWCDAALPDSVREALGECSWLKVNAVEAEHLTGEAGPEQGLRKLAGLVRRGAVVTLGAQGSIGVDLENTSEKMEVIRQKPRECGAFRDACGAGDAYAAGMLLGFSRQLPLAEAMRMGAILSGYCVTWFGGSSGDGLGGAVQELLEKTQKM